MFTLGPDIFDYQANHRNIVDRNQWFGELVARFCKAASCTCHGYDNIQQNDDPFRSIEWVGLIFDSWFEGVLQHAAEARVDFLAVILELK
jgi:hypothetical protein